MFNYNHLYTYNSNGVMINFDTLHKAKQDLINEIQAVIEYDTHIHSTSDKIAKETWNNIKPEELVHIGKLLGLPDYLDPSQKQYIQNWLAEFS